MGAGVAILWAVKRTRSRWDVGTMQRATVPIVAASILSVSYTHLDVYKRQAIVIAVAIYSIALHVVPAPYSGVLTACLPLLELPILWPLTPVSYACLLYTSDVYKRQSFIRSTRQWPKKPSPLEGRGSLPQTTIHFGTV